MGAPYRVDFRRGGEEEGLFIQRHVESLTGSRNPLWRPKDDPFLPRQVERPPSPLEGWILGVTGNASDDNTSALP